MALKFVNPFNRNPQPEQAPQPSLRERAASIPSKAYDGTMKVHRYNEQHPRIFNQSHTRRIKEM
jgi:hypothetical protein